MKKLLIAAAIGCVWFQTQAADLNWGTDLPKALAQAKAEKKMVLLDFTGSDWCGWCIKFDKETLSTDKFAEYAKTHLELVVVDFPNKKPQSDALKAANKALGEKYKANGYPTFVLLNADGKEIGRQVGYAPGGPEAFIAKLEKFSKP
ncbi:MAG: thioredoxin family protein [Verrucomicrobiales bacterium]|nr:thioredoxin family protein [Verrucomicrobiales bacterium]